jgi:hypothetical protein
MQSTALVYDIEIVNGVPDRDGTRLEGYKYCEGWHDHAGMGISVIGAYDYAEDRYRVFCADNFEAFLTLCAERAPLVSFNGLAFDDKVIDAEMAPDIGVMPPSTRYDILVEIWRAAGLAPRFGGKSHGGYGLDAMGEANFGIRKSGNGALAPILWQDGRVGEVIDYCLNDIRMTKRLFDSVLASIPLICPKTGARLELRTLEQVARTALV